MNRKRGRRILPFYRIRLHFPLNSFICSRMISVRWNDFSAYFSPELGCSGLYSLSVFLSVEKVRFSFRFCKRKEPCGDVVSEDAAELKIVWLRMKNRLAENDFSIGADFFAGLLSGTWSLKVRRKEKSLSVPVTKGTDRLL